MDIKHEKIEAEYRIRIKKNWNRQLLHWHQRIEIALVQKSRFSVTIQGNRYLAEPGDILVIRSGEIHDLQPLDPEPAMKLCIFSPTVLHGHMPFVCNHISANELRSAGIRDTVSLLFSQMLTELEENQKHADWIIRSQIQLLYGLLARHFEEPTGQSKTLDKFQDFQNVLSYISENYHHPIDLSGIAKQLNYNPSYVSAMFVTYTGMNYKTYLDSIRINEASRLLLSTADPIANISMRCGYENIRTFNNVFRRITGMTPSQFRNNA